MFGIGFSEIIIIFLILIIFIRPDDLPKVLRTAGRLYGKAKRLYTDLIQAKDKIINEINEVTSLDEPVKPAAADAVKVLPASKTEAPAVDRPTENAAPPAETPKQPE